MNVLIIADESMLGAAWGYLLEERGYKVFVAGSGSEALAIGRKNPPDVIVFDADETLRMAQGLATLGLVSSFLSEAPILVLAPWSLDREAALSRGATVCITKPVDYGTVLRLVDMMASRPTARKWSVLAQETA